MGWGSDQSTMHNVTQILRRIMTKSLLLVSSRLARRRQCGVDANKTTHLLRYAHFGGEHIVFFWGVAMESVFDGIQFYFLIWNCRNDISNAP